MMYFQSQEQHRTVFFLTQTLNCVLRTLLKSNFSGRNGRRSENKQKENHIFFIEDWYYCTRYYYIKIIILLRYNFSD